MKTTARPLPTRMSESGCDAWTSTRMPEIVGHRLRSMCILQKTLCPLGCVVNSDTGKPVIVDESRLTVAEFEKVKISQTIESRGDKSCRPFHSPLWQANSDKIRRMAPIEFIGRYMPGMVTRFATRFTNSPAIQRKAMLSGPCRPVQIELWASLELFLVDMRTTCSTPCSGSKPQG